MPRTFNLMTKTIEINLIFEITVRVNKIIRFLLKYKLNYMLLVKNTNQQILVSHFTVISVQILQTQQYVIFTKSLCICLLLRLLLLPNSTKHCLITTFGRLWQAVQNLRAKLLSHHIFYAKTITMQICAALVSPIKSTNLFLLV